MEFLVPGVEVGGLGVRCGTGFRFEAAGADQVIEGVVSSSIARQCHPVT